MDRAHLLSKQTLKHNRQIFLGNRDMLWDERIWVPACRLHHAEFDAYKVHVPRESLPKAFLSYCDELGLGWAVDRRYGKPSLASSEPAVERNKPS